MSRVIDWIFDHQWAITEDALRTILAIANRDQGDLSSLLKGEDSVDTQALSTRIGQPLRGARKVEVVGGTALIPVTGPIFPRANIMTEVSGATSLDILARDFRAALENPEVRAIVFNIDSPGGEVAGVSEFSDFVFQSRGQKPIISYVFGTGASAAYWIASASDEIVASPTALLGSIGVISAFRDTRVADEKSGVKKVEFVSSVSPLKRLDIGTDEGRMQVQTLIDNLASVMVANIARNRGVTEEIVTSSFGKGGVLVGSFAVASGLANRIGSLEQVISEQSSFKPIKGGSMDFQELKAKHPEVFEAVKAEGRKEAEASVNDKISQAKAEGAKAEAERVRGIEALALPGAEAIIAQAKLDPTQTAQTVSMLIIENQKKALAERANATTTDAEALAKKAAELSASSSSAVDPVEAAEEKKAIDAMVAGLNSKK